MEMKKEELRNLVVKSYELTVLMPNPKKERNGNKYTIESRNKFKSLPEALRQMDDASASITHFVKTAAYFIPRKDAGVNSEQMMPFMEKLLRDVTDLNGAIEDSEVVREQLKYLIGYANWNADAICAILTAYGTDRGKVSAMIKSMLSAELKVVDGEEHVSKVLSDIERWISMPERQQGGGQQHHGGFRDGQGYQGQQRRRY